MAALIGTVASAATGFINELKPDKASINWKDVIMITAIALAAISSIVFGFLSNYYYCVGLAILGGALILGEVHIRKYSELKEIPEILEDIKSVTQVMQGENQRLSAAATSMTNELSSLREQNAIIVSCTEGLERTQTRADQQITLQERLQGLMLENASKVAASAQELTDVKGEIQRERAFLEVARKVLADTIIKLSGVADRLDLGTSNEDLLQLRDEHARLLLTNGD